MTETVENNQEVDQLKKKSKTKTIVVIVVDLLCTLRLCTLNNDYNA